MQAPTTKDKERPYGGVAPDDRRKSRREKLIDAGFCLFGSHGYAKVTIEQLCAEASVGIRSLYSEFGNRETLFQAVYDRIIDRAYEAVKKALENRDGLTTTASIRQSISVYLHEMLDDPRNGRIVSVASSHVDPFWGKHRNDVMRKFAALNAKYAPPMENPHKMSMHVWSLLVSGGINEVVLNIVTDENPINVDELADQISEFYIRTLGVQAE